MMSSHIGSSLQISAFLRNAQQQMVDRFPLVSPAGQPAGVVYTAAPGDVRALNARSSSKIAWPANMLTPVNPVMS